MSDLSTLERAETTTAPVSTDDGDHERFAHYVRKKDQDEAWLTGKPVTALCGKKWLPQRDPKKYPVCPECKAAYNSLPPGGDDNKE